MPIANNNIAVVDLPMWEVLQPLPASATVGMCLATDPCGTSDYIYYLSSATAFYRYSCKANAWQQLASPPGGTVGAGTCMLVDATSGYVYALITSGTGAPTWQYYDPAANAWTARSVVNLPGTFGTDGALAHPCTTVNAGVASDDYIYLVGNGATVFYRFQISTNAWIATLTAVTAAPGAGCGLHATMGDDINAIVCIRGGATATVYEYSISGNSWATLTYYPATETFTTGSMNCYDPAGDIIWIERNVTMSVYAFDIGALTLTPQCNQYLIASGTAIAGCKMVYIEETNGIRYLYMGMSASTSWLRTPIYF